MKIGIKLVLARSPLHGHDGPMMGLAVQHIPKVREKRKKQDMVILTRLHSNLP